MGIGEARWKEDSGDGEVDEGGDGGDTRRIGVLPRSRGSAADQLPLPRGATSLSSAYLTAAPPQISAHGRFLSGDLGPFAPFVLAADACGVILVHAYSARVLFDHSDSGSGSGSSSGSGGPFVAGDKGGSRIGPCLYVIDTFSAAADFLPDRNTNPGLTNFALVVHNHEGVVARSYSVMELVLEADSNKAQLWEFSSASGVWSTKTLTCPIHLPWNSNISFVFEGKIWWVDLCRGLLSCDFSAEGEEELSMTLLPDGLHAEEAETLSTRARSHTWLYLDILGDYLLSANVLVWILVDPKHSQWKLRTVTPMSVIWDTICHALGLQRGAPPVISVLDRQDASVLYFFMQQHLVGFHLTRRLVKHSCICGHQGGTSRLVLSMGTPPIAPTQGEEREDKEQHIVYPGITTAAEAALSCLRLEWIRSKMDHRLMLWFHRFMLWFVK
uniref:F-box protein At3g26010-like beta-propeller domain-containing protein n=1 Tax=Oryza meridionalis TaxID=40149 RepID=A0A0E0ESU1_9ORYZ